MKLRLRLRVEQLEARLENMSRQFYCLHDGEHFFATSKFDGDVREKCSNCNKTLRFFHTKKELVEAEGAHKKERYINTKKRIDDKLNTLDMEE